MDARRRAAKSRENPQRSGEKWQGGAGQIRAESRPVNVIPTGRQLPRTPPASERKEKQEPARHTPRRSAATKQNLSVRNTEEVRGHGLNSSYSTEEPDEPQGDEELRKKMVRRPSTVSAASQCVQLEELNPDCFIRGMQGYQWTAEDLEFVQQTKNLRQVQQLQAELKMLQKQLKDEQHQCSLSFAARDKVMADLGETADFDRVVQLSRDFLRETLGSTEVELLDPKSVMSLIQLEDVEQATRKEKSRVALLEEKLSRSQDLLSNEEEKWQKEVKVQEKRIFDKQAKVNKLEKELADLKNKQSQVEEILRTTQSAAESLKASKQREEQEEQVDMSKVLRRSKRIARRKENFLQREAVLNKIRTQK